jgi:asparagine synthetase B (glutamine-hydrolysing)
MIKFANKFSIPHFLLVLSDDRFCEIRKTTGPADVKKVEFTAHGKTLSIEFSGIFPAPTIKEDNNAAVVILGSPIYDDIKVDAERTAKAFLDDFSEKTALELVDGEFLAIYFGKTDGTLKIINDRFTAVPLHYFQSKEKRLFCASPHFSSLWKFLKIKSLLEINQEAFFEFLFFQRIFGTKTLARGVFFLPDAQILEVKDGESKIARYWQRNYTKNNNPLLCNAAMLADFLRQSVKLKTSDGKRYGHFLSGGMDSRSVLAAFDEQLPTCFTVGISDNREVRTARKIAETKGAKHLYFQLHPEHYGVIRETAVKVCGGMFNYDHALFLGYNDEVIKHADTCFNGYGFDFMFQGMYIPAKTVKFGSRNLYLRFMSEPPDDLVSYFINNASYRIKGADIWKFVKNDERKNLEEFQRESINEIYRRGQELTDNKYDLWEYFTFHHISRHYSYPNAMSIKTFSEARIASFTNEIFDLYLALPAEQRFNGRIEKETLKMLDPKLAKIPSANTGLPVTASSMEQTIYQIAGALKRRILGQKDWEEWTERTWPSREFALQNYPSLKNAALEIINSNTLEQISFLDIGKIREEFPRWLNGEKVPGISGDLVQTIVTIGTFLTQS